ncbi:AAA family ATPase [Brucella sp. IR073]|uniref:AAA family ATPase n=1 Tax=unclassified Brucella TaxID=2632610 RepID=UPI003B987151
MRLSKIEFTNFRCFRSEAIEFGDYTSLVGPNNCGKSTALRALNLFFGGASPRASNISAEDFYIGAAVEDELRLRFEFVGVTGQAANEMAHYVRNERLVFEILATRNEKGVISSRCRGIRYGLLELVNFFAAATAGEKRPIYEALQVKYPDEIPTWRNMQQAGEAIRAFEASKPSEHVAIPSEESAYGATGPIPKLKKFIDWIYVPAVKDASTEASEQRESAFSKLISFAVRNRCDFSEQITRIKTEASEALRSALGEAESVLAEVGGEINREFKNLTATPIDVAIEWGQLDEIAVREPVIRSIFKDGRVLGGPEIFGHGLQRTYLMALLSLAARAQGGNDNFRLLLGIEEPELYQHPPQSRFLASALADLSANSCQVIVTTHSPHFISGRTFESVRVLRKRENATRVNSWTIDQQRAYVAERKGVAPIGANAALSGIDRTLQTSIAEMFFAGKIVLVEGPEDIALIEAYLRNVGNDLRPNFPPFFGRVLGF